MLFSGTQMLDEESTKKTKRVGRQECCIYKKNYINSDDKEAGNGNKSVALSSSEKASHVRAQELKRVGKKESTARIEEEVCCQLLGHNLALSFFQVLKSESTRQ